MTLTLVSRTPLIAICYKETPDALETIANIAREQHVSRALVIRAAVAIGLKSLNQ